MMFLRLLSHVRIFAVYIALLPQSSRLPEICGFALSGPRRGLSWFVASLGGAAGAADAAQKAGAGHEGQSAALLSVAAFVFLPDCG